ncbi:MAG: hypothetical protein HC799_02695 [Limnothrix sp. RL_2_0]|nr:hypothetical protein [Limnothrix sp. RL_2_0]
MPSYLSPGVYVEEVASGSAPIAGVGTSIAAFIGTVHPAAYSAKIITKTIGSSTSPVDIGEGTGGAKKNYVFENIATIAGENYGFFVDGEAVTVESVTNGEGGSRLSLRRRSPAVQELQVITNNRKLPLPLLFTLRRERSNFVRISPSLKSISAILWRPRGTLPDKIPLPIRCMGSFAMAARAVISLGFQGKPKLLGY